MSVAVLREEPFSELLSVTVAPGMTAPLGSVIVPRSEAVDCECATGVAVDEAKISTAPDVIARLITPPPKQESPCRDTRIHPRLATFFFSDFSWQGPTLGHPRPQ